MSEEEMRYFELAKSLPNLLDKLNMEGSSLCDNEEFVKICLKTNISAISFASERLRSKKSIMYRVIKKDLTLYKEASESLLKKKSFAQFMARVNISSSYFEEYFNKDWVHDKKIMGKLLGVSGYYFSILPEELKADKKWLLALVKKSNGFVFRFFEKSLKNDKEFVLQALKCRASYRDIGSALYSDEDVLREALKNESCFLYASEQLRSNKEVVKRVLKLNPGSYADLSEEFKNDKELLVLALETCNKEKKPIGFLEFIPNELRTKEIAQMSVELGVNWLFYFKKYNDDESLVLKVLAREGELIDYVSERLRKKYSVVLTSILNNGQALSKVEKEFRENYLLCYKALKDYPWIYSMLSEKLKDDKELAKIVIKQEGELVRYSSERLRNDLSIILLGQNRSILRFASDKVQKSIYYAKQRLESDISESDVEKDKKCILWLMKNRNEKECKEFLKSIDYEDLGIVGASSVKKPRSIFKGL